jgi:4-hydroxyphenylpyruvate dioxygenase-like putative hemolysin
MPTEDFVRNYGRRMHHVAYEIQDGDHAGGEKNIDFVVDTLKNQGIDFLAQVVGECKDTPNLKQIFSKHSKYSLLITEYIERCHGYEGFFTKSNVAALTQAAGEDERYQHGNVFD